MMRKPWKPSDDDNPAPAQPVGRAHDKSMNLAQRRLNLIHGKGESTEIAFDAGDKSFSRGTKATADSQRKKLIVAVIRNTASPQDLKHLTDLVGGVSKKGRGKHPQIITVPLKGQPTQELTVLIARFSSSSQTLADEISRLQTAGKVVWSAKNVAERDVKALIQSAAKKNALVRQHGVRVTPGRARTRRSTE